MGRGDAGPPGRSDAERGVGPARVFPAPARHSGAGRGVWAGAGVRREALGGSGCPAGRCPAPRGPGAATRREE